MNMFRTLRADEIDCRIAQIKENGLSLLLYKDARCDQNILDETVGPMFWKREHTRDNRNCIVSIWSKELKQWVSKEDTGTESNTEREKGLASDSFKRACFNWGIGRELYTAPFIWINAKDCNLKDNRGKVVCYDRFTVKGIGYTDGVITGLEIKNQATGKVCYKWGEINEEAPDKPEQPDTEPQEVKHIVQDSPAVVKITDKIPESKVLNYIKNEIADIREKCGIETFDDAKQQVQDFAKALVKTGKIPNFSWKTVTMDEAKAIFKAIREMLPVGDNA
jgi:hypothetical protein